MPTPDASHSISKALEKSGRAEMGALVSKNFVLWKTFSCFFLPNGM